MHVKYIVVNPMDDRKGHRRQSDEGNRMLLFKENHAEPVLFYIHTD